MSSDRDIDALRDILHACNRIAQFIETTSLDEFRADMRTQAAILHELMIVGEATKRLSAELRSTYDDVAWSEIAGMRDMIVHQYDRISTRIAWETATGNVPQLRAYVEHVLVELSNTEGR